MSKKKKLLYKDLDTLRFLAFIPLFLYFGVSLLNTGENVFISDAAAVMAYLKQNSVDFFFFLSAFLLTAHGLRELKYNDGFSIKWFYIRRGLKILPVFILMLLFTFLIHPWIVKTLQLTPINLPEIRSYLLLSPNYSSNLSSDQYIYLAVVWMIYMFIQYYVFWGIILKFFAQQIKTISYGLIGIGLIVRVYHILNDSNYEFDVLAMGIPVGIGALLAYTIRREERFVEFFKELTPGIHLIVYIVGILTTLFGYIFLAKTYTVALVPIFTCLFYSYVVVEQTYGKNSILKFRKSKLTSRLGKISYGLISYSSIIMVLGIISIASLELDLSSLPIQIGFLLISALMSWIAADISYNFFERPILSVKSEFKRS